MAQPYRSFLPVEIARFYRGHAVHDRGETFLIEPRCPTDGPHYLEIPKVLPLDFSGQPFDLTAVLPDKERESGHLLGVHFTGTFFVRFGHAAFISPSPFPHGSPFWQLSLSPNLTNPTHVQILAYLDTIPSWAEPTASRCYPASEIEFLDFRRCHLDHFHTLDFILCTYDHKLDHLLELCQKRRQSLLTNK